MTPLVWLGREAADFFNMLCWEALSASRWTPVGSNGRAS